MSEKNELTDREKIIKLVEILSDGVVRQILIYTQGLIAGQNIADSSQKRKETA